VAEGPEFRSSITASGVATTGALTLTDLSRLTKMVVRAGADTEVATSFAVGFGAGRRDRGALIVGQRPGEWHVLGSAAAVAAVIDPLDTAGHVSVINLTHGRATMRLTGAAATGPLEKICSLDWSEAMTPNYAAVSASVAKVTCDIVRDDQDGVPSYLISCDRSLGQYLFGALVDAGDEFGLGLVDSVD
jgi:sarcosine oxidase subunit alpha